jgi:hypothetical protein
MLENISEGYHFQRFCLFIPLTGMSEDLQYVLSLMLEPDERLRPTVDDVLSESVVLAVWKRRKRQRIMKQIVS